MTRLLAAVFATAVTTSATALARNGPSGPRVRTYREAYATEAGGHLSQRHPAPQQRPGQPQDAAYVVAGGPQDVDPAVGVVHPVDRDLVDAQAGTFGQDQQLGVEEPCRVLDQRQELVCHVRTDRLEAALRVWIIGARPASTFLRR